MTRLGDVLWQRVNSCRTDHSVSFHIGGAALDLIIVRGSHLMGMVCGAPSSLTISGIPVMYFLISTDIIMYFGSRGGGGKCVRMNGNG